MSFNFDCDLDTFDTVSNLRFSFLDHVKTSMYCRSFAAEKNHAHGQHQVTSHHSYTNICTSFHLIIHSPSPSTVARYDTVRTIGTSQIPFFIAFCSSTTHTMPCRLAMPGIMVFGFVIVDRCPPKP
jgi:hypothetical protein